MRWLVVRDLLVVGVLVLLAAAPSLVAKRMWFAWVVAEVVSRTDQKANGVTSIASGRTAVCRDERNTLFFSSPERTGEEVASVNFVITWWAVGHVIDSPLRVSFSVDYVANPTDSVSTEDIDELVRRDGLEIQLSSYLPSSRDELRHDTTTTAGVQPGDGLMLYPQRTMETVRRYPRVMRGYFLAALAASILGLSRIGTVRAVLRHRRGRCVRCGYPRAAALTCTECALVFRRPLTGTEEAAP